MRPSRSQVPKRWLSRSPIPRANTGTHWLSRREFQGPPYLLLVQRIVLQPIYLQELLGHPDAGQLCKDPEVAGHPKACKGAEGVTRVVE